MTTENRTKSLSCMDGLHDKCGGSCNCSCHHEAFAVSHSRVESYLSCQRKEFYSYSRKIRSRKTGLALTLGTEIHAALEVLYRHVLTAGSNRAAQVAAYPQAVEVMWAHVEDRYAHGWEDSEKRASVREILENYLKREPFIDRGWDDDTRPWLILAAEKEFNFEYDPETKAQYPFVIDLIVKDPNGRIIVVDHKGLYDFYDEEDVELKPQIVKYIGSLRGLGYKIHSGLYNMLRTRPAPKTTVRKAQDWAKTLPVEASTERIVRTMGEQIEIAARLRELDQLDPEERDQAAVRSAAGTDTCKRMCDFRDICTAELSGRSTTIMLRSQYEAKPSRDKIEVSDEA